MVYAYADLHPPACKQVSSEERVHMQPTQKLPLHTVLLGHLLNLIPSEHTHLLRKL